MSRVNAVAPDCGAEAGYRGSGDRGRDSGRVPARRSIKPATSCYMERALLLWPRLNRARIRRVENDPARIAEIVERRTSQPYAAILAMLTREPAAQAAPGPVVQGIDRGRVASPRGGLRIVRSDDGHSIQVQDLRLA